MGEMEWTGRHFPRRYWGYSVGCIINVVERGLLSRVWYNILQGEGNNAQ